MNKLVLACLVLAACSKSSPAPAPKAEPAQPAPAPAPAPAPVADDDLRPTDVPGLMYKGDPIKQDPNFPKDRWVRTVLFDGKTPYIGFTYVDASKGNCIKGEEITGLSDKAIKKLFSGGFPSSSMEPIPEGHPMTLLTPEEIKKYGLPAKPEWVSYYEP
jgi:hypothetical protein